MKKTDAQILTKDVVDFIKNFYELNDNPLDYNFIQINEILSKYYKKSQINLFIEKIFKYLDQIDLQENVYYNMDLLSKNKIYNFILTNVSYLYSLSNQEDSKNSRLNCIQFCTIPFFGEKKDGEWTKKTLTDWCKKSKILDKEAQIFPLGTLTFAQANTLCLDPQKIYNLLSNLGDQICQNTFKDDFFQNFLDENPSEQKTGPFLFSFVSFHSSKKNQETKILHNLSEDESQNFLNEMEKTPINTINTLVYPPNFICENFALLAAHVIIQNIYVQSTLGKEQEEQIEQIDIVFPWNSQDETSQEIPLDTLADIYAFNKDNRLMGHVKLPALSMFLLLDEIKFMLKELNDIDSIHLYTTDLYPQKNAIKRVLH